MVERWATSPCRAKICSARFPGKEGDDAQLDCDIVDAGKMRNGAARWWCRTHQRHWGTKGDIAGAAVSGKVQCANHDQPMSHVVDPEHIDRLLNPGRFIVVDTSIQVRPPDFKVTWADAYAAGFCYGPPSGDELMAHAASVFGSLELAEAWVAEPAMGLDGARPIDLIKTPEGSERISVLLGRLARGVYC